MIDTALITAAGAGTRLRSATAVIPKVMLPLVTTPAIEMVVTEALEAGIERVVIVVGRDGDLIRRHFEALDGPWHGRLIWAMQPEPRGLGDAVLCGREAVGKKPFTLLFGDSVFLDDNPTRTLATDLEANGESVLAVQRVTREEASRRGMVEATRAADGRMRVRRVVEKPTPEQSPSDLSLVARCAFRPTIFQALEQVAPDASGEIELTPAINTLIATEPVAALEVTERRLDIGNPRDYFRATLAVAERHHGLRAQEMP